MKIMGIHILITHHVARQIWSWQHSSTPPRSSSQKHPRKLNHNSSAHTKVMLIHLRGWPEVCSCSCVPLLAVTCMQRPGIEANGLFIFRYT